MDGKTALKNSQILEREKASRIVKNIPKGVLVIADINSGNICFNQRAAEILELSSRNYTSSEEVLQQLKNLHYHNGEKIVPEDNPVNRVIKGETLKNQVVVFNQNKKQKIVIFNANPIYDSEGKIEGAVVIVEEITEYKQLNRELERNEQKIGSELEAARIIQDYSTAMIQAEDVEEIYDFVIDAVMVIMRSDLALLHVYHPEGEEEGLWLVRHRGFGQDFKNNYKFISTLSQSLWKSCVQKKERVELSDTNNSSTWDDERVKEIDCNHSGICAGQSIPLLTRHDELLGIISTYWDTPRVLKGREIQSLDNLSRQAADLIDSKKREKDLLKEIEELKEINRRKNEFLSLLSHEIRNPLSTISMGLTSLEKFKPGEDQFIKAKEILRRQMSQLIRLVDDLLAVTRINRNKIVLQKRRVEINNLVREVVETYSSEYKEKGISLKFEPCKEGLYASVDPDIMHQVLINLLHNSLKFNDSGGKTKVFIKKDREKRSAVICVEDNGRGIATDALPYIFEPFTQGDWENSDLGLGLSLVKGLTELHGGSAKAYSEGLGKGTSFEVSLPLEDVVPGGTCSIPNS